MFDKIKLFLKNPKNLAVVVILIIAAYLRLNNISGYMTFLGDEGRDAITVWDILHGHFTLLGPRASAGDFYLGPIYYYMIAPFLLLFNYDPVGPAVMIALLGIATVYLVYRVGKEFFGYKAGMFAAALYAVSPLIIAYSRSSWNPNPLPLFSLLALYLLYRAVIKKSIKLYVFTGILLGISIQLHYLAIFLCIIVFLYILFSDIYNEKAVRIFYLFKRYFQLILGFIVGFSPFLAFEARHGFPNTKTILNFIFSTNLPSKYEAQQGFVNVMSDVFFRVFGRLVTRFPPPEQINVTIHTDFMIWQIATVILIVLSIVSLMFHKNKLQVMLLSFWFFLGVTLFGFYKRSIYDYYFAFMFPLPFLLVGNLLSGIFNYKKLGLVGKIAGISVFALLFIFNLNGSPFQYLPNNQKQQVKLISDFVLSKTDDKPFNFALLTLGNSDHSYRYFFKLEGRDPVPIENFNNDPQRESVTDQLLIVCEDPSCQPLGNSLWEVAGFGRAEIAGQWGLSVVKVYKLVHYKGKD